MTLEMLAITIVTALVVSLILNYFFHWRNRD